MPAPSDPGPINGVTVRPDGFDVVLGMTSDLNGATVEKRFSPEEARRVQYRFAAAVIGAQRALDAHERYAGQLELLQGGAA